MHEFSLRRRRGQQMVRQFAASMRTIEAVRYRLTPVRRVELETGITTQIGRSLTLGHQVLLDWQIARATYSDRQIVNLAKTHGVQRWRTLRERCQIFQSLDIAEYVITETILLRQLLPPHVQTWLTVVLAICAVGIRQGGQSVEARVCVPVICSYLRAMTPRNVVKVCTRQLGVIRVAWWRHATETRAGPVRIPWGRLLVQTGLVGLLLCAWAWPDHPASGVLLSALSANSVWEVRTAGNDTNGGGFVTGAAGTDYSQQDAKNTVGSDISTTDAVAVGTTTITSVTANFGTTIVGNIVYFQGGTGAIAAQWRQVTARASTTSITIDAAIAASTGMTLNIGGALASPGQAGGNATVSGMIIHGKAGTYSITSATANIAGGCVTLTTGTYCEGYQTVRGDLGTPPLLQASGISTFTIVTTPSTTTPMGVVNLRVDGAGLTASRGFVFSSGVYYKLTAENCTNNGFSTVAVGLLACAATGCSSQAAFTSASTPLVGCVAYSNTVSGLVSTSTGVAFVRCLSYSNSGASSDGFSLDSASVATNCASYGNGRDGYRTTDDQVQFINCIAEGNSGWGWLSTFGTVFLFNCAGFNNTAGNTSLGALVGVKNVGFITGSASFFTNAAGGDFSLNTTAGGGAVARAAGLFGVFPVGLTTGFLDVGAAQHADPAGSGGGIRLSGRGGLSSGA